MSKSPQELIKEQILAKHSEDSQQLEVIFSEANKILVEAPAGCGKTRTLVSKIAYMIAIKQIVSPKRLLALTFSVNAAYKIKKDVAAEVPSLLASSGITISSRDKVVVSNYHGFCRSVLKKYGWKLDAALKDIDSLKSFDDSDIQRSMQIVQDLPYESAEVLSRFSSETKSANKDFLIENCEEYCDIVIKECLSRGFITYNGILALTKLLFLRFPGILQFYRKYFPTILVDEYQDTNVLSFEILNCLVTSETKLILLGDSLQRIYGFIGAIENLLSISINHFHLLKISLTKNYRFAANPKMLALDRLIRKNAENTFIESSDDIAEIDLVICTTQLDEAINVAEKIQLLIAADPDCNISILVKQRSNNIQKVMDVLSERKIEYFYGLFSDEDVSYLDFHRKCLQEFWSLVNTRKIISKGLGRMHLEAIITLYQKDASPIIKSLMELLEVFWFMLFSEFSLLSNEEKLHLVEDTFSYNGLKQYLEKVDSKVIISTVHASKGMEWDYVILPDIEQDSFPNWPGLCNTCRCREDCKIVVDESNEKRFFQELSIFYVAVTRAKKEVFFSASKYSIDNSGRPRPKNLSCLIKLPGIKFITP